MSHVPQRVEKDCLNCGTIVQGHYCHNCGQENVVPKETFWHMVTHFFYDITHFDSNFFTTLKDLIFKPGFLTKEYMMGRRKSHLHPVRMYVFTSAVFFLVFFSMFSVKESDLVITGENPKPENAVQKTNAEEAKNTRSHNDSLKVQNKDYLPGKNESSGNSMPDSVGKIVKKTAPGNISMDFGGAEKYRNVKEYDSLQKSLPENKRDNWLEKIVNRKLVGINERYKGNESKMMTDILNKFLHSLPYLLFLSLPLYAMFLKLIYIRRKQFYFADHAVFLIHLYIFTFLFMLLLLGLNKLFELTGWNYSGIVRFVFILAGMFYTLKALRNFYGQGWGKTISKFLIFNFLCFITAIVLFALFFFFSVFQI